MSMSTRKFEARRRIEDELGVSKWRTRILHLESRCNMVISRLQTLRNTKVANQGGGRRPGGKKLGN
eukprot:751827-Hanusia_phi.AAC.1